MFGEDIQTLRQLARDVKETVAKVNGTYNIKDSFGRDMYTLEFDVNESVMDEKLVNYADLTKTIRLASDGMDLGEFDTGRDLIDMTIYSRESKQDIFNTFRHLTVPNAQGVQIPLTQLVDIKPNFSVQAITHRNLERPLRSRPM